MTRYAMETVAPERKFNLALGLKRNFDELNDYFGLYCKHDLLWFYGFYLTVLFMVAVVGVSSLITY